MDVVFSDFPAAYSVKILFQFANNSLKLININMLRTLKCAFDFLHGLSPFLYGCKLLFCYELILHYTEKSIHEAGLQSDTSSSRVYVLLIIRSTSNLVLPSGSKA